MSISETLLTRLTELLDDAQTLVDDQLERTDEKERERYCAECAGWLAAASHVATIACPNDAHPYREHIAKVLGAYPVNFATARAKVSGVAAILSQLDQDANAGLLTTLADATRAETFDSMLDHAQAALDQRQHQSSGVLAGVVFEDVVRRGCEKHSITENGVKLDELISELGRRGMLSGVKAKRARAAAAVRTSATHARWDEYTLEDVDSTIRLSRELIDALLQ